MGDAIARVEQLRDCFQRAKERLEALPETGLSEAGQPYIEEVAEALQSFAAWFHNLTLDDMSLSGSARRVHVTLTGLDAIADWVGLHRSQQFAADLREHVGELVEQSEALDAAVFAAFTVKKTPAETVLSRNRHVPQKKRDAVEDGIETVASLAGHLGIRLQRIAQMVGSQPTKAIDKPASSSRRAGRSQNDEALARDLLAGWKAFEPEDGRRRKRDYLARRADVRVLKTEEARQRKIDLLLVALNSALHLQREKTKQKQKIRG